MSAMRAACGAGMSSFAGELLHSHAYRETPYSARFGGKRVAVVGFGNSALDLAVELSHICPPARYTFAVYSLYHRLSCA